MSQIVEVNEDGGLYLPARVLEDLKPHRRFVVHPADGMLILQPEEKPLPFWATATPEEQAEDLRRWVANQKGGPGLPDEALHRENMYD